MNDSDFEEKEDELEALYLHVFSEDIRQLKKFIKEMMKNTEKNKDYSTGELEEIVARMNKKVFEDELYGLLFTQFCAEISSFDIDAPDTKVISYIRGYNTRKESHST